MPLHIPAPTLKGLSRFLCPSALAAGVLMLASSCSTDLPLPTPSSKQKIVLLGELSGGDSVLIRGGQSRHFSGDTTTPEPARGLQVTLKDASGAVTSLQGTEDYLSPQLLTIPFSNSLIIQPGAFYSLEATHPDMQAVSANVYVPEPFSAELTGLAYTRHNFDTVLRVDISISDPGAGGGQFIIEAVFEEATIMGTDTLYTGVLERNRLYTTDTISVNLQESAPGRTFKRIFLPGDQFSSVDHATRVMAVLPYQGDFFGSYKEHGRITFYVKSVSDDYFRFLQDYEDYIPSIGLGGNLPPARLEGNVAGGFGMIGGAFVRKFTVKF